ncbi:ArnT family glycosyltransferase [Streptomyces orinoci]|uniref:Glycosyltransferase family 39 protein n=1 Tax=Streptomyces orinoci TaxID=67339 RepID=A0ABV3JVH6_STRON|nr:glycosyltransferase family 39 protein [Streptomyces orinoci]
MATTPLAPTAPERVTARRVLWKIPADQPGYARPALWAMTAAAAVLYAWGINHSQYHAFYADAVRSMTQSWKSFFYGSFDPRDSITLDKLPGFLWPQAISARIFGFHPWALTLPQVIEGVLSLLVLHRVVRRWAGTGAALIACAAFLLTPVAVGLFRTAVEDPMFTLCLLLAAEATQRAAESGRLRPLLMAAVWVGVGFQAKMLEAWAVLPALALVYLVSAPVPLRRRLTHLAGAAAVTLVVSASWTVAVTLIPAKDRPYVDGTTNNSALSMVVGYNFLNRFSSLGISAASTGSVSATQGGGAHHAPGAGAGAGAGAPKGAPSAPGDAYGAYGQRSAGQSGARSAGQGSAGRGQAAAGSYGQQPAGHGQAGQGQAGHGSTGQAPDGHGLGGRDQGGQGGYAQDGHAAGGHAAGAQGQGGRGPGGPGGWGQDGWGKMFGPALAAQTGWLYPLGAIALICGLLWRRGRPRTDRTRAGFILWGTWLAMYFLAFSAGSVGGHTYYMGVIAVPLAALSGGGLTLMWRAYRARGRRSWALPGAVAATAAWSAYLAGRFPGFLPWLAPTVALLGAAAAVSLVIARTGTGGRRLALTGLAASLAAVLIAPSAWAVQVFNPRYGSSGMGAVGPTGTGGHRGGGKQNRMMPWGGQGGGRPGKPGGGGFGRGDGRLTAEQRKLLDYTTAHRGSAEYLFATTGWSQASPYILATGADVLPLGGFSGRAPFPTEAAFRKLVRTGKLTYVLTGGERDGFGAMAAMFGGGGGGATPVTRITDWVRSSCAKVPAAAFGGDAHSAETLYRCR